jgi:hypothetical protein
MAAVAAGRRGSSGRSRGACAAVCLCVALAACGGVKGAPTSDGSPVGPGCAPTDGSMPLANLGPDLTLRVLCGTGSRGAIASVNDPGPGSTSWSVSLAGDQQFSLEAETFFTCTLNGPSVAMVDLQAAAGAVPGDTYEAVATIRADDDSFPTTTVALHGEVVAPHVTAPTSVDFGAVPAGSLQLRTLRFNNASPSPVAIIPSTTTPSPFSLSQGVAPIALVDNTTDWTISLDASPPGDYTTSVLWTASPSPQLRFPAACLWTQTIALHVHVVDNGDGGPDANRDGGTRDLVIPPIIP